MRPIGFPRPDRAAPVRPARPTWFVTWEETDDEREFVIRLRAGDRVLARRIRLASHAEAGA